MKKVFILFFALILINSIVANLNVEKISSDEVLIAKVGKPAVFDLKIKNNGESDNFEFYNFLGFSMYPKGTIFIGQRETKEVQMEIYPINEPEHRGYLTFQYFIKGENTDEEEQRLTVKIIDLKDAFETGSGDVDIDFKTLEIYVKNKENFNFEKVHAKFNSVFFDFEEDFSLAPYEKKVFNVQLNRDDFRKLMAGFYTLDTEISYEGEKADLEGVVRFNEKDLVTTTKKDYGFIVNTQIIEKINKGNIVSKSEIVLKKNIISRLFTSFSPEPDIVERTGANIYYTWSREIKPGESLQITVKTNWLFPLIIILFIIAVVVLVKQHTTANMIIRKKVSFVRTKGGEFALKVTIFVNAKKHLERVSILDRLPPLVKIHEKFGNEQPVRVNEKTRRIEWNFEKMERGETRILSYIVYSKVGVVGKFALPSATAIYEKDGEVKESNSNRTFFMAETRGKKDMEDY